MASSPRSEAGYATPAALVLCLAFAMAGSALAGRSLQQLSLAKADLERTRYEIALDGALLEAAAAVVRSGSEGPYAWVSSTDLGWVFLLAEREADKLALDAFDMLDDEVLTALGVDDPSMLRARAAAAPGADTDVGVLDPAPLWRECGPNLVSGFGEAESVRYRPRERPSMGVNPPAWRIGETWRIRASTQAGWREERIVRFTGDARHPSAVVARRLWRAEGGGDQCEDLLMRVVG